MHVGEKSEDPCHPDYVPTIFEYLKSPEKNRAKRKRQLEKYELSRKIKRKRLRAALSESDKENVREEPKRIVVEYQDSGEQGCESVQNILCDHQNQCTNNDNSSANGDQDVDNGMMIEEAQNVSGLESEY